MNYEEMQKEDREFFDRNWRDWIRRNPKPENWQGSNRDWALTEMPCRGILGKIFYYLGW